MPCPRTLEQQAHKTLGGFAPKNLSNNLKFHAIEFSNLRIGRARAASRDRSIEQESMMSEEKS